MVPVYADLPDIGAALSSGHVRSKVKRLPVGAQARMGHRIFRTVEGQFLDLGPLAVYQARPQKDLLGHLDLPVLCLFVISRVPATGENGRLPVGADRNRAVV